MPDRHVISRLRDQKAGYRTPVSICVGVNATEARRGRPRFVDLRGCETKETLGSTAIVPPHGWSNAAPEGPLSAILTDLYKPNPQFTIDSNRNAKSSCCV